LSSEYCCIEWLSFVADGCCLQIDREGLPFKDAINKRVEIDEAVKLIDVPLKIGDTVVCAHGTGVLVECGGPDDPCIVEIDIGGLKNDSVFGAMKGNAADSGRVRRPPILFCASRAVQQRETIDGTRYDPGDHAIAVIWCLHQPLVVAYAHYQCWQVRALVRR
jgi:hypothetical protein